MTLFTFTSVAQIVRSKWCERRNQKKKFAQTIYDYTVKDSFDFAKDITQQSSKLFMASLDVDSLFTNVPLDETIEICVNELFKSSQTVSGLNKQQVLEMLSLTTKEKNYFI